VSKHQSNRRKSYGRRQHEVAERRDRSHQPDSVETGFDELAPVAMADRFVFLDQRTSRLQFALGD
jgi:hypothetical protein